MKVLHRVMGTRCGNRLDINWAAMGAVISDAKIIVMACAWNQRGASCIDPAVGSGELHDSNHVSNFLR